MGQSCVGVKRGTGYSGSRKSPSTLSDYTHSSLNSASAFNLVVINLSAFYEQCALCWRTNFPYLPLAIGDLIGELIMDNSVIKLSNTFTINVRFIVLYMLVYLLHWVYFYNFYT